MKIFKLTFNLFLIISSLSSKAQLVPDSSFATNGYFITNYTGLATFTHKIHELSNGDLLAIGTHDGNVRIWKYNATGQLITSFGNAGIASNPALDNETGNSENIYDFEVYDNGKIMVLSNLIWYNPNIFDSSSYSIALASFNADGSINTNFNSTGYKVDKPNSAFEFNPFTILMNKNEGFSFYVGGEAYQEGHSTCPAGYGKWFICKYKIDGSPDLTFNNTGLLLEDAQVLSLGTTVLYPHGRLRDLAFLSNGSVRAVGAFHNFDQSFFDIAIKPDGTFDPSFGTGGITKYDVNYSVLFLERGTWSKILNDGSVLFYTTTYSGNTSTVKFIKHKIDGTKDLNFGVNGLLSLSVSTGNNFSIIYKSDNSMLLNYYNSYGTDQKIEFMHIKPQGILDSAFGINGLLKTQPIVPDVYVNPSSVYDGIWNANETSIFLAAAKQPITYSNFGIFKYKWPGLIPLSNQNLILNSNKSFAYPNPIKAGQTLFIKNIKNESKIKLLNYVGETIELNNRNNINEIEIPSSLSNGNYFLQILLNNQVQTITLLIENN